MRGLTRSYEYGNDSIVSIGETAYGELLFRILGNQYFRNLSGIEVWL